MPDNIEFTPDPEIRCRDYRIGCIGAGFIMADVHLAAYADAGFDVVAIASRTVDKASAVAERWGIPTTHATPEELLDDENVQIVENLLHSLILLDFNLDSAHNFGRITEDLQKKGKPTGELDAIIGSICLAHGEVLVTKNIKHFKMIEGLFTQAW